MKYEFSPELEELLKTCPFSTERDRSAARLLMIKAKRQAELQTLTLKADRDRDLLLMPEPEGPPHRRVFLTDYAPVDFEKAMRRHDRMSFAPPIATFELQKQCWVSGKGHTVVWWTYVFRRVQC